VTGKPGITLACIGLMGTLVPDYGIIELAFAEAIATQGVVTGTSAFARCMAQVHRARGRAPADVLMTVFPDNEARAQAAHLAFEKSLAGAVARTAISPIPGARQALDWLAATGCRVCVMTSLPRRQLTAVLQALRWRDLVDVALSCDEVPRGCPSPDLALAAMLRVGVDDVQELAVVHGTAPGVECGRRAGARVVVGALTGPHPAARLRAAGATHLIDSIAHLPDVLAALPADAAEPAAGSLSGTITEPAGVPSQPSGRRTS
jgi:phosphoglycolate phosphatase